MTTIAIIAKPCVPGRVKTRLTPPLTYEQGAEIAQLSLDMTVDMVRQAKVDRRILFWDGTELPDAYADFELLVQPAGDLDERLGYLFDNMAGRSLLLGMDTPQITAADIETVFEDESQDPDRVWYGPANDGGYWGLAMNTPTGDLIRGVPMSAAETGAVQVNILQAAGRQIVWLPRLTDIDHVAELRSVAQQLPGTDFAERVAVYLPPGA